VSRIRITQRRSIIRRPPDQKGTMRALGLRRIGHSVTHEDTPVIRGMIFKVKHLVEVDEAAAGRDGEGS
jgi:large subunit ribosomal protein L30